MLVINTRPEDRAASLTSSLLEAGYQVEALPLLELVAQAFSEELQHLYQQIVEVQVIVVVSPTAVKIGMDYLKQAGIQLPQLAHVQWIAVGQKTAQALAEYGIISHIPEIESSEGMLELPVLKQQNHFKKIAFWRGLGGRQFMMQYLQQQGIDILNFVLYRRQCPEKTTLKFAQFVSRIQPQQSIAVLISSEASWHYWQQLCQAYPDIQAKWIYLVLGERLVQFLSHAQAANTEKINIIRLENLSASEMMQRMRDGQGNL